MRKSSVVDVLGLAWGFSPTKKPASTGGFSPGAFRRALQIRNAEKLDKPYTLKGGEFENCPPSATGTKTPKSGLMSFVS
jgi:hypothetical protein